MKTIEIGKKGDKPGETAEFRALVDVATGIFELTTKKMEVKSKRQAVTEPSGRKTHTA